MDIDKREEIPPLPTQFNQENVKPLPPACIPNLNNSDKLLQVPRDGACDPNCAAAHVFGTPTFQKTDECSHHRSLTHNMGAFVGLKMN